MSDHNPFATRFTRPGALGYLFPPGESAESLVDHLRQNGWRGEIIGPHGSGKSTLLAALLPRLAEAGRVVAHYALHQGEHALPISRQDAAGWNEATRVTSSRSAAACTSCGSITDVAIGSISSTRDRLS